jgi:hypothetical protein
MPRIPILPYHILRLPHRPVQTLLLKLLFVLSLLDLFLYPLLPPVSARQPSATVCSDTSISLLIFELVPVHLELVAEVPAFASVDVDEEVAEVAAAAFTKAVSVVGG